MIIYRAIEINDSTVFLPDVEMRRVAYVFL
jgi:hypothetical protein